MRRLADWFLLDLRYAARSLARSPGFTAVAVLCLALGIGANTTTFGVVDALLFRAPSGIANPADVARIYFSARGRAGGGGEMRTSTVTNYPNFVELAATAGAFSGVAAFFPTRATFGRGTGARQVQTMLVSGSFFSLLGVEPAAGRFFGPSEDQSGDRVAVIGNGLWRRQFAGNHSVIGKTLWIGDGFYVVIGVAPPGFTGADLQPVDVWVPIRAAADQMFHPGVLTSRGSYWISVLGRLAPGVTRERASAIATLALRRGNAADPVGDTTLAASLYPIQRDRGPKTSDAARASVWTAAAAAVVLLIACANLAGLLLARYSSRRRELAVRLALGAGRGRLASQLLAEAALLTAAGCAAAVVIALWCGAAVRAFLLPQVASTAAVFNARVLLFTAAVSVVAAALCGLLPALSLSRVDVAELLRSGSQPGPRASGGQSPLVVGQIALTLVLVFGAGLFVQSLRHIKARVGGLDVPRLLMVTTEGAGAAQSGPEARLLYGRMRERLAKAPGIVDASAAVFMPLISSGACCLDEVSGATAEPDLPGGGPYIYPVEPSWLETAGTRMVRGRGFTAADRAGAPAVAVVSETMARAYWPGVDPIGKCLMISAPGRSPQQASRCFTIVGIAQDVVRNLLREPPDAQYYLPLEQFDSPWPPQYLLIRTRGRPGAAVQAVRAALQDVAPDLPFVTVQPMDEVWGWQLKTWQMGQTMFGAFALLGLVLAAAGLYGLVSFVVARRTAEIAVRMALGADGRSVWWLIVRRGLGLALLGVAVGTVAAIGLGRALASLLFEVSPFDPMILGAGAAVLLAVAGLASYVPALRAVRLDPALALRAE